MTTEEIIQIALEAGAKPSHHPELWDIWNIRDTDLVRFANLIVAHEKQQFAAMTKEQK
jgi:hypothetical protein